MLPVRLTGTQVVSWTGLWLLLAYSAASMLLANTDLTGSGVLERLALSLGATLVLFALLEAWVRCVRRWPALNSRTWRVIVTFAVLATARAVLLAVALQGFGLTETIDWPRRVVGSVAGFTAALVIVDLVLGSIREHRRRVTALVERQDAARHTRDEAIEAIESQRAEVIDRISVELVRRIDALGKDSPDAALATLHSTAEDLVRPLSHELAQAAPAIEIAPPATARPRFDMRAFLDDATRGKPLSPTWVAVLFMVYGGPFLAAELPWGEALVHLAVGFVVVWALLTASNEVMERVSTHAPLGARVALLVGLLIVSALLLAVSSLVFIDAPADVVRRVAIGDLDLLVIMSLLLVAARAVRLQDETIEREMETAAFELDWASARARCIQWQQQRSLARAMHGPVQGAIATAVARLEQAMASGIADQELLDTTRGQLIGVFEGIQERVSRSSTLESTLTEFADTWHGVCEITWVFDDDADRVLGSDAIADFAAREIVSEACWNALRHARPTRIDVTIGCRGARVITISVIDDGAGTESTPGDRAAEGTGLGTAMLHDMTLSWHRFHRDVGTELVADLPADETTGAL